MPHRRAHPRPRQRGFGLFDAMISLAILSFGMLAMTRFQTRMVAQTTESQSRQVATQLAAEHLSTVLVDVANAGCYTVPFSGTCANAGAKTRTAAWAARVATTLPGTVSSTVELNAGTGLMTLVISWTGKGAGEARTLRTVTDVRP
jgi:type IV pilus assembly protein PilV